MSSDDAVGELICPITGEVFLDPVLLVGDGHTYEREAAERWLAKHATSPLSGQALPPHGLTLVPNHALRKQAAALLEERGRAAGVQLPLPTALNLRTRTMQALWLEGQQQGERHVMQLA